MTPGPPDAPFPGARSQVTARPLEKDRATYPATDGLRQLSLEASPIPRNGGWVIRVPVRAEHVTVDKKRVVYERVIVRRVHTDAVHHVDATVRREELRVDVERS